MVLVVMDRKITNSVIYKPAFILFNKKSNLIIEQIAFNVL